MSERRRFFNPRYRRIYILPTMFGVVSSLALFMMLLMAYTYQSNLAYAMTFFLTAFGFSAMTATHRFLKGVDVETYRRRPVFEGEVFDAPVLPPEIQAPRRALEFSPRESAIQFKPTGWVASRRGVHELSKIQIKTSFPTGFFRAWTLVPVSLPIVVAPRPRDFGLRPWEKGAEGGDRQTRGAEPEDLRDLAPARPEDPPSRIHWASFARGRGRLRKEFEAPANPVRALRWDDTEKLGNFEDRLAQMAAWVQMMPSGTKFSFSGPDGRVTNRIDEALESLARAEAKS